MKYLSNLQRLNPLPLFIGVLLMLSCPILVADSGPEAGTPYARVFSTEAEFEDAKSDLIFAIEGQGLVISYTSHAQEMLDRTADVVGAKTPVYGNAEIILFCKSDLSHYLVQANPHNLVLCPYAIAIYTVYGEPETTYLSFREPPSDEPATKEIRQLLEDIIEEVI